MAWPHSGVELDRYSKENRWYYKSIDDHISSEARKLLEEYSHIPADKVDSHIYTIRDTLWAHTPYPCIGEFKFLILNLPSHPFYHRILKKMDSSKDLQQQSSASPSLFLDLGCCVAQELRALAHAGIHSDHLYGSDLNLHFLDTSYDLFMDNGSFKGKLVATDIFSPDLFESGFKSWENKFDIVHAGLFLHLFSWEQQVVVCCTVIKLLSRSRGSLFVGEMVGCEGGGERNEGKGVKFWKKGEERKQFLHDDKTWKKMWVEVAEQTETVGKWQVMGNLKLREKGVGDLSDGCAFFKGEGIGWFTFSIERVG